MTFVRTNDQVAVVLTKETFHRNAVESMVVVVAMSCSRSTKPQAVSWVMTQPQNVDQTWNQYAPKVLKSSCALDHLTLEQLSNNESWHSRRDGVSSKDVLRPENGGRPLACSQVLRKDGVCETYRLFD